MSEREICPGTCNARYRKTHHNHKIDLQAWAAAEEAHAEWRAAGRHGPAPRTFEKPTPPKMTPRPAEPIWCRECTALIRRALTGLDDLMALRLVMADGYQVGDPTTQKVTSSKTQPSQSAGQDDLDELLEWLGVWEVEYRRLQQWATKPYRGDTAPALTTTLAWLGPRLDQMLAVKDGFAEGFGSGILMWFSRLQAATSSRPPSRHKPLPCPRCGRRSLFLHDDGSIRCRDSEAVVCGRVMSEPEYGAYEDEADREALQHKPPLPHAS